MTNKGALGINRFAVGRPDVELLWKVESNDSSKRIGTLHTTDILVARLRVVWLGA